MRFKRASPSGPKFLLFQLPLVRHFGSTGWMLRRIKSHNNTSVGPRIALALATPLVRPGHGIINPLVYSTSFLQQGNLNSAGTSPGDA